MGHHQGRQRFHRVSIGQSILDFSLRVRDQETGHWVTESGIAGELYIVGNLVVSGYSRHADGVVLADEKATARLLAIQLQHVLTRTQCFGQVTWWLGGMTASWIT